jgi:hypothetical protein
MRFAPVTPPPVVAPPLNLVTSSRNPLANGDETDGRWVEGFAFQPGLNVDPDLLPACGSTDIAGDKPPQGLVETVPWWVQAADRCTVLGYRGRDWIGRATDALRAATPKGVEFEFWTGELATANGWPNLFLANGAATDVTPVGGPVTIEEAIGLLEQALADCGAGGRGMIHCAPVATPSLAITHREGPLLLTVRDTIVVPGVGYPGTDPSGAAPAAGTSWLYATGMVDVRLGDIVVFGRNGEVSTQPTGDGTWGPPSGFDENRFAPALMNRDTNELIVPAARPAAAVWDGVCHFAVHAQIPTAT